MNIEYKTAHLYQLFLAVGWVKDITTKEMISHFNIGLIIQFLFSLYGLKVN